MTDVATKTRPERARGRTLAVPSQRGSTTIADRVIEQMASIAANEVDGVVGLGGSLSRAMGQVVGRVRGKEHTTPGVEVEVSATQAAVDLMVRMHYPASIPEVTDEIRRRVVERIGSLAGLQVVEVNIAIIDLVLPGESDEDAAAAPRVQ
jgi:uncharacterized alkaline shock family protein YloU